MDLSIIICLLILSLPLTFSFILRAAIFCIGFYLKRKHSIILKVSKCGLTSFRTIVIKLPTSVPKNTDASKKTNIGEENHQNATTTNTINDVDEHLLSITIDQLRLSSSYFDTSCTTLLSIHATNITIKSPIDKSKKESIPIKFGSVEFPIDKLRGDFFNYHKSNFNITVNDVVIISENFSYRIEKLTVNRSTNGDEHGVSNGQQTNYQRIQQVDLNCVIFSDLSIPEVNKRNSSNIETSEELTKQRILFVEHVQITHQFITGYNSTRNNNVMNVAINGDFFLKWNLQFHLNLIGLVDCLRSIRIKSTTNKQTTTNSHGRHNETSESESSPTSDEDEASSFMRERRRKFESKLPHINQQQQQQNQQQANPLNLKLSLDGRVSIAVQISDDQNVCLDTESLDINAHFPGPKTLRSKLLHIHFDEHTIVSCSMASITHYQSPGITCILDRNQSNCNHKLSDGANSLMSIEMDSFDLKFPYKYNFSDAFNERFMGIVKWLKLYHKSGRPPKVPSVELGPLDFDMSFKINRFNFSMADDPFEMKLRNNYMLLEDEYKEQLKRDQSLQEKLNELKKTNLMLASSIVEDLIKALAKKNSDIYIQRSRQLYASQSKKEAPLFNILIEEADLKILADSSFHQHSDIKQIIRLLNPDAPLPEDTNFTTIFCRIISSNFKSIEIYLRDFPQAMLTIRDFTIKGQLVGTEQTAVPRARRMCQVYTGSSITNNQNDLLKPPVFVERSMTPLKFYHNLQLRCTMASYTHGPCWDPVLAQVSISFEDIVSASVDPSPSLPWWDKMRLLMHGQAKLNCNHLSVNLHASNDPYNQTEMIELSLSRSIVDWQGDRIRLKGDFDILLRFASRYDECRIVHIPNFDVNIQLEWLCVGNKNDHHAIMPCAPDKVPEYSSHHTHDSYRSFRSQNLNCSINLDTQYTSPTSSLNPENMPSMLFFGSTIRWLENQKFIFVGPTKLTRRGILFNNIVPRKQPLSRLFKNVRLCVNLNRLQILYWSSVSKRHGIQIIGGELMHSSEHSLKLVQNKVDKLKHRSQCDWQTVYMNSELTNVDLWLFNLGHEDLVDEFNEFNVQNNLKNRQYFISFRRLTYNKVAPPTEPKQPDELLDEHDKHHIIASNIPMNTNQLNLSAGHMSPTSITSGGTPTCVANTSLNYVDELQSQSGGENAPSDEPVPNHKLVIHDLKAAWTKDNRDVVVGIFDAFIASLQLKRNLSTEALKPIRKDQQQQQQQLNCNNPGSSNSNNSAIAASCSISGPTTTITTSNSMGSSSATNSSGVFQPRHQRNPSTTSLINSMNQNMMSQMMNNSSVVSSVSKSRAVSMLQKLIADSENNPNVYTEESHSGVASETHLYGVEACQMDDVVEVNCSIELINSQVVLCGTETPGYVIVSAAQTEITQATHLPVWKNNTLLSKTTWTGSLHCMQYYATVDCGVHKQSSAANECRNIFTNKNDIQWLDPDDIDSRSVIKDFPDMVGSGHSVGGVVSSVVGRLGQLDGIPSELQSMQCNSNNNNNDNDDDDDEDQSNMSGPVQLQRIISRCNCQFYYASHTTGVSDELQHLVPPSPDDDMFIEPWDKEVGVDSFTLTHQDLEISTNSQQYAMILDIIHNLLLKVEPHKKSAFENLERMRFRFQLSADEDQRVPISKLQDQIRKYVAMLKKLERERYLVYRASIEDSSILLSNAANSSECNNVNCTSDTSNNCNNYRSTLDSLSRDIQIIKDKLNTASEELAMMISCYKEFQSGANKAQQQAKQQAASQATGIGAFFANVIRRNEICFESGRWRVTDSDGQLGLADIVLNNFLYSEVVKSDDSVEHTIELGHLCVSNLIPNQAYKDVLRPTELQANIPLDRQRALRVYCRELAPVGGIPVKEHLEVNVVPFTIEITLQFFQKMVKFFFPEKDQIQGAQSGTSNTVIATTQANSKDQDKISIGSGAASGTTIGGAGSAGSGPSGGGGSKRGSTYNSSTSANSNQRLGDEIEKMRERASKNHTFVHVKIPGIPIKVSYKGKKQKNVTDLKNLSLTLPTFEYHNALWTWLDLLMAVKNDSKHTVIKQALKQKMKIRPSSIWSKNSSSSQNQSGNNNNNNSSNSSGPNGNSLALPPNHHDTVSLSTMDSNSSASTRDSMNNNERDRNYSDFPVTDEAKARLLLGPYAKSPKK